MKYKFILVVVLFFGAASSMFAQSGQTGPLTWTLTGSGNDLTLTITVTDGTTGEMPDYTWSTGGMPWASHRSNIAKVVIGNGVTKIGNYAFFYHGILASVEIPSSVTTIGRNAFSSCDDILSLDMPNVTTIGERVFDNCKSIVSFNMPKVTTIGEYAFCGCSKKRMCPA